jgi:3-hydroxybutyrate dehydrogenase
MVDPHSVAGRTALVTGSIGGLGYSLACALAEAGANVMLCDLCEADACTDIVAGLTEKHGGRIAYQRADLADANEVERLVAATIARFGTIEILVNNAVVRHFAPIESFPLEHWNRALSVNLTAAFLATQLTLPEMRKAGYGRIFNLTSVYGTRGTTNRVDYVTTKTALHGLTRATALEVAADPISCHGLTPGTVQTPGVQSRIDALMESEGIDSREAEDRFLDGKQPSGRFVDPASVAAMMLLLCGPVGRDMNGAILPIEGGWLARS